VQAWRERFVRTNLDLVVLHLLRSKPRWGYEINVEIRDKFEVYLSAGTLYPLLHSLENKGYVHGIWESEARGRRIYKLTQKGKEFLDAGKEVASELLERIQT